ncbi:MAG: hypothetical protein JAY74_19835 [Candidatus Thiodiazotropha taylori]|nr:hypothetical protein [Candidatus Thiodiazotropha taylori]
MLISVRFDDNPVFTIKASITVVTNDEDEDIPQVTEAFFTDISDTHTLLDIKSLIATDAIDTALRTYFSESLTESDFGSTDHSVAQPE